MRRVAAGWTEASPTAGWASRDVQDVRTHRPGPRGGFLASWRGLRSVRRRMDKTFLVEQLGARLRAQVQATHKASSEAREDARSGAARAVNMAMGQGLRSAAAREALDAMDTFKARPHPKGQPIGLGAVVELEGEEGGKTLFLAPTGAGEELTGPDGDGFFSVVTPVSPLGKAVMGKRLGQVVEVTLKGELTEWTITYVA